MGGATAQQLEDLDDAEDVKVATINLILELQTRPQATRLLPEPRRDSVVQTRNPVEPHRDPVVQPRNPVPVEPHRSPVEPQDSGGKDSQELTTPGEPFMTEGSPFVVMFVVVVFAGLAASGLLERKPG